MKKRLAAALLVAAISACVSSCGKSNTDATGDEEYIIQEFDLVESNVEEDTMPEELPTEVEDYDLWTRETEWCKVAATKNASIYANADDDDNLYVSWNGIFGKCNWGDARVYESDLEMTERDIDNDGEVEVLVIQQNNTGSSSGEEEFHLLDMNGSDTFTDSVIPMDDFWEWVKEISSGWLNSDELEDMYLYTTTVKEDGLTIDTELEKHLLRPIGEISVQMVWQGKTLKVRSFTFTANNVDETDTMAVSIDGADGPTSIFLAGKVGGGFLAGIIVVVILIVGGIFAFTRKNR
jgi:hypothetical protein